MGPVGRRKALKVEGDLDYVKLDDRWNHEFTDAARESIDTRYPPFGALRERRLTQGELTFRTGTADQLPVGLLGWFRASEDRPLRRRILRRRSPLTGRPQHDERERLPRPGD